MPLTRPVPPGLHALSQALLAARWPLALRSLPRDQPNHRDHPWRSAQPQRSPLEAQGKGQVRVGERARSGSEKGQVRERERVRSGSEKGQVRVRERVRSGSGKGSGQGRGKGRVRVRERVRSGSGKGSGQGQGKGQVRVGERARPGSGKGSGLGQVRVGERARSGSGKGVHVPVGPLRHSVTTLLRARVTWLSPLQALGPT
jgi:hypothetical protein